MKKVLSLLLLISIISCASNSSGSRSTPDWIYNKPQDTAETLYFVGGPGMDRAVAEIKAYREVSRLISVEIESVTESEKIVIATEKGTEFVDQFNDYIKSTTNATIYGVEFIEHWRDPKKGEWWVLGKIDRAVLKKLIIEKAQEFSLQSN
ncbi:MAG: LPP20 family lipoprotein [Spirochaetales bacterium]|nr:LPP20 family lipoprotein [Spirochaetales bacterium]